MFLPVTSMAVSFPRSYVIFQNFRTRSRNPLTFNYYVDSCVINRVTVVLADLGVLLERDLLSRSTMSNWSYYADYWSPIRRMCRDLGDVTCSLVRPVLEYACCWS